ncbi:hypothetical protein F7O68_08735 [Neisseria meningitidis]|nr:hypothetical protein [Neisseria meningitidis]MBG8914942.1 hypothetical protein [Neisseria meningitidis]MBG8916330.1 hypothetical protein [Neisseria meningitidis]MBG8924907.1 hypothetical protein [Neisseria meningitidis]MBG8965117.1 hypothetical protein [Neisseria meningitidis]
MVAVGAKTRRTADALPKLSINYIKINILTQSNKPFFAKQPFFYIQSTRYFRLIQHNIARRHDASCAEIPIWILFSNRQFGRFCG